MEEVVKTRRLKIASVIFIAIIIIGFLTFRKPAYEYALSVEQTAAGLSLPEDLISLSQAKEILNSKPNDHIFIDLRSPQEYSAYHIENSINMFAWEILNEENFSMLRKLDLENNNIIFYGNDPLQANGVWLLTKQLGIKNGKAFVGEFKMFLAVDSSQSQRYFPMEKMILSDSAIKQLSNPQSQEDVATDFAPQKNIPVKKVKKKAAGGGC